MILPHFVRVIRLKGLLNDEKMTENHEKDQF